MKNNLLFYCITTKATILLNLRAPVRRSVRSSSIRSTVRRGGTMAFRDTTSFLFLCQFDGLNEWRAETICNKKTYCRKKRKMIRDKIMQRKPPPGKKELRKTFVVTSKIHEWMLHISSTIIIINRIISPFRLILYRYKSGSYQLTKGSWVTLSYVHMFSNVVRILVVPSSAAFWRNVILSMYLICLSQSYAQPPKPEWLSPSSCTKILLPLTLDPAISILSVFLYHQSSHPQGPQF